MPENSAFEESSVVIDRISSHQSDVAGRSHVDCGGQASTSLLERNSFATSMARPAAGGRVLSVTAPSQSVKIFQEQVSDPTSGSANNTRLGRHCESA